MWTPYYCNSTVRRLQIPRFRLKLFETHHHIGLYDRRPMVCVSLTQSYVAARRNGIKSFSDGDMMIGARCSSQANPALVYNMAIVDYDQKRTWHSEKFDICARNCLIWKSGMMVWAGMSINGRTDLYIIRNWALTAQQYRDEILRLIVLPYAEQSGMNSFSWMITPGHIVLN